MSNKAQTQTQTQTPPKKLLALDQATSFLGFAVFEGQDLTDNGTVFFRGDPAIKRIALIRKWLNCKVHEENIDFVAMEDIQQQKNVKTFRVLAQLLGVLECYLFEKGIPYRIVHVKTWRKELGIPDTTNREKAKASTMEYIEKKYDIENVEEDAADAICIGECCLKELGKKPLIQWE